MAKSSKSSANNNSRSAPRVSLGQWIQAARLRTLPLAGAPVIAGVGVVLGHTRQWDLWVALGCLLVALFLQIGVNFANDYSDGIRGTDEVRVGPVRLTASGVVNPKRVLLIAMIFFASAALSGLAVVVITAQWWLLAVGAAAIIAAWFYTGGKRPYGYAGLGELFVFVFFGLVATVGTVWVQLFDIPQLAWFVAVAMGLFSCAVLMANNLRDRVQDAKVGKRTLSVLLGKRASQIIFTIFVLIPFVISAMVAVFYPPVWLTFMVLLGIIPAILIVWTYREPRELVTALSVTSLSTLAYAIILAFTLAY